MGTEFGARAHDGRIRIVEGCRFKVTIRAWNRDKTPRPFPAGVEIRFDNGVTWPAAVSGNEASWEKTAAEATIPALTLWRMVLQNAGGSDPDPMYIGKVERQ